MKTLTKTALTVGLGALAAALDSMLAGIVPSGGFSQTLASQPAIAVVFASALVAAHNYLTKLEAQAGIHPAQTNPPA